jgi:hypothetical protein
MLELSFLSIARISDDVINFSLFFHKQIKKLPKPIRFRKFFGKLFFFIRWIKRSPAVHRSLGLEFFLS